VAILAAVVQTLVLIAMNTIVVLMSIMKIAASIFCIHYRIRTLVALRLFVTKAIITSLHLLRAFSVQALRGEGGRHLAPNVKQESIMRSIRTIAIKTWNAMQGTFFRLHHFCRKSNMKNTCVLNAKAPHDVGAQTLAQRALLESTHCPMKMTVGTK
jgi:hypothetical protein